MEHLRRYLAVPSRALQCSLAMVNLATYLGRMKPEALPNQVKLRELVDVMGVLSTESALSLIPCFDRQTQLFMARKKGTKGKGIEGLQTPFHVHRPLEYSSALGGFSSPRKSSRS